MWTRAMTAWHLQPFTKLSLGQPVMRYLVGNISGDQIKKTHVDSTCRPRAWCQLHPSATSTPSTPSPGSTSTPIFCAAGTPRYLFAGSFSGESKAVTTFALWLSGHRPGHRPAPIQVLLKSDLQHLPHVVMVLLPKCAPRVRTSILALERWRSHC